MIRRKPINKSPPKVINIPFLKQFEPFNQSRMGGEDKVDSTQVQNISEDNTPDEIIDLGYKQLRNNIKSQIFAQIKEMTLTFLRNLFLIYYLKWDMVEVEKIWVLSQTEVLMKELMA